MNKRWQVCVVSLLLACLSLTGCGGGGGSDSGTGIPTVPIGNHTTYYVRLTGNDQTGDGSNTHPWRTINHAEQSILSGDTVKIGDGVYAENSGSGSLTFNRAFASSVLFQAETGAAGNVTVTGASNAPDNVEAGRGCHYVQFRYLKFATFSAQNTSNFRLLDTDIDHLEFDRCSFVMTATPDRGEHANVMSAPLARHTHHDIRFDHCTFGFETNSSLQSLVNVSMKAGDGQGIVKAITFADCQFASPWRCITLDNAADVALSNCTANGDGPALDVDGGANVVVTGGTYTSGVSYGIRYGADDVTGPLTTGSLSGVAAGSTSGHAMLIGAGCVGVNVDHCQIQGGNQGLVIKECGGGTVSNNKIEGGSLNSLYFKAAHDYVCTGNTIRETQINAAALRIGVGDFGDKPYNLTCQNNAITASGSAIAIAFDIDHVADNPGDCTVDNNQFFLASTATLGKIRGITVHTLADMQAAWTGYDIVGNDDHSTVSMLSEATIRRSR